MAAETGQSRIAMEDYVVSEVQWKRINYVSHILIMLVIYHVTDIRTIIYTHIYLYYIYIIINIYI